MQAIIIDTETTGLTEPALVEAAWLEVMDTTSLYRGAVFTGRFNPGKPIEFGAMATHHITDEDIADMPPASDFHLPNGVQYLIGHNVDYDYDVVLRCGPQPNMKRICTLAFCRKFWPDGSHTLGAMLYRLEGASAREHLRDAHSASADVQNCWRVLTHIIAELGEPATWEEVWTLCEAARIPDVMAFGKWKGTRIADVPGDYKSWLLRQDNVDPYLRIALKR